ncbi:MAG: translocation/assembly module TamB domain-containing protein, partial [Polyangiaceae bacterium]|nr:translocation/assembly module TamB domain-containing protein [Polyangiaceae bacterium]
MTTTHRQAPLASTRAVAPGAEPRPPAWDRRVARVICAVLALLGVLPFALGLVVRSPWARSWAARATQRLLGEQGVSATYTPSLRLWPLGVELEHVRVESTDGGPAALTANRILVRPKLFALLAGKLAIDQIDLDEPHVRAVVRDGKLTSLALPKTPETQTGGPLHAPFATLSLTDASLDLDVDGTRVEAAALDVDATAEDDRVRGSSFEVAIRAGAAEVHRRRVDAEGAAADDDDALCSLEGRVRIDPGFVLVRRLEAVGAADLDRTPGGPPLCSAGLEDKRRVEVSLGHVRVQLPRESSETPAVDGHVRMRVPIALAERLASHLPDIDGWLGVDVDVRYASDTRIPDVSGKIEARDVRVAQFAFAQELHSEVTVRQGIVRSPLTTVRLGNGLVTLSDTVIAPLARGLPLERMRVDGAGIDFTTLLRNLGVHPHSWVGWDIRELHTPVLTGTLWPLRLDGEMSAKTYSFGVYDRPAEDHARERLFGFSEAQLAGHVAIRKDALRFSDLRATLPHSEVVGGYVSLGFDNVLRVKTPVVHADLKDISPIGPVALQGNVEVSADVDGTFAHPLPEGDIHAASNVVVSDVMFGDVSAGHVVVDTTKPEVVLSGVHAKRRSSAYDVPTGRLSFGGDRGFVVDAQGSSDAFGLRDLLSMFGLDDDPRFEGLDATMSLKSSVHVAAGGPEDACGSGYVTVDTKTALSSVSIYGERFARGNADVALRWYDREQGIAGADLDVRSFVLDKVLPASGGRAAAAGTIIGSATLRRGGALTGDMSIDGVPLGRLDVLGVASRRAHELDGSLSGVAQVTGQLDDFKPNAGFTVRTTLDAARTRMHGVPLAPSHVDVAFTHRMPEQTHAVAHSRCGAPVAPPFDRAAYGADGSSHDDIAFDGSLLGQTVTLSGVHLTRGRSPELTGRIALRGVDVGPLSRIGWRSPGGDGDGSEDEPVGRPAPPIGGQVWGEILLDDVWLYDLARSRARVFLGPTMVSRGGQKLTLQPPREPLVVADDALVVPPLQVTLETPEGFHGGFELTGGATKLMSGGELAFAAKLHPIDLAVLEHVVPRVDRAAGRVEGSLRVTGRANAPAIGGELHITGDDLELRGVPSAIGDVVVDVSARASELVAAGTGKFAGGTVAFHASAPIRGFGIGALDSRVAVRDVRLAPAEGVTTTVDADLDVAYDPAARSQGAAMPHVSGDVTLQSLNYTRPITFNLDLASARAKRTEVDAYDPSLDYIGFDVRLRSRAPITIKNNLAEVQLAFDQGTLEVMGTNQRAGLRGSMRTLPGGRFHFQSNEFEVQQGLIRFDDPTRIDPNVDITAMTEYRRYSDTSAGAAAGSGPAAAATGSTRGGSLWRITMHAYGDAENVQIQLTSEPALAQQDIVLLLTVGMTRAELDQLQATGIGEAVALNALGAATGADRAVKQVLPIIDD